MRTHKLKVTISADHQLAVRLPDDFPLGPAEVIIQAEFLGEQSIVKLAGVLTPKAPPSSLEDPIAEVLQALRRERQQRAETHMTEVEGQEDS